MKVKTERPPAIKELFLIIVLFFGGVGSIIGFIIGLYVYPPTAWAAAIEIGLPSAVLGVLVGGIAVLITDKLRNNQNRK